MISCVSQFACLSVCLCIRALREKRLELSTRKAGRDIQPMAGPAGVSISDTNALVIPVDNMMTAMMMMMMMRYDDGANVCRGWMLFAGQAWFATVHPTHQDVGFRCLPVPRRQPRRTIGLRQRHRHRPASRSVRSSVSVTRQILANTRSPEAPAAADIHLRARLATLSQCLRVRSRHIGPPACTCLSRCSAMNARPHAAEAAWQALCLIWQ